ncbi:MAG: orotidine-5'-phosphate decarboxylase [Hyphomonas sp.]|uniref:orotidine-5'-phosphate decarboxylase n=1 Tax=Hyphomonas sp. TaxID=87 RepID=UPI001DD9DBD3|nr:orotidine-5'-phosphate decarboxylase [Hyphomonas sp.]MBA4226926.1 orotidine-5'-phosphate decarboxylase [Hyphomonas sp.]
MTDFATRLLEGTRKFGPLCVGIDPHPGMIPELFGGDTPEGVWKWSQAIIEAAAGKVAVVKPQVSLFERHGPEGMAALQAAAKSARAAGLIVLMDAKRGDIGSTAEGYAQAYLAPGAPFEGDALTVNPYMGLDTLEPYAKLAKAHGKGVIVLVRTSNPGAGDFQSRIMGGAPLYVRVAEALGPLTERLMSPCGWSSLMMVIGATAPEEARAVRALAPKALFLVPGYGAQGAGAAEACSGLVNGEGGVVSASRSVTFPKAAANAGDRASWRQAVEDAILDARDELRLAAVA